MNALEICAALGYSGRHDVTSAELNLNPNGAVSGLLWMYKPAMIIADLSLIRESVMGIKHWILIIDGTIGSLLQITPVGGGLFHTDCLYEFQSSLPQRVSNIESPQSDSTNSVKKVAQNVDELLVWIEQMNERFYFSRLDVFASAQTMEALRSRRPLKLSLIMHEHCIKLTTIALSHPEIQNLISGLVQ